MNFTIFAKFWKVFIVMLAFSISHADGTSGIANSMQNFFQRMGMQANGTEASSFQDQSAGYYVGGSITARNQTKIVNLAHIQLPSLKAGCGGIDLYTGGFSFVKGQELVQFLRNIGSATSSYAFMLGLQTVSPQIYNTMGQLQDWAQKINAMNINSCETAANLLGSVWPKTEMASQHLCKSMGAGSSFSDWAQARHECGKGAVSSSLAEPKRAGAFEKMMVGNYNLAWQILNDSSLSSDHALKEFFMSVSGTLISKVEGDSFKIDTLPSLADHADLVSALLQGGEAEIYWCDHDKCLNPQKKKTTIPKDKAFLIRVQSMLRHMVQKIYGDEELSGDEKRFLNETKLPVYKILNVLTAYKRGQAPLEIEDYTEVIAHDMVLQYLMDILDVVLQNSERLRALQLDDSQMVRFQNSLLGARKRLVEKRTSLFQHLQMMLSMVKKTQMLEQQLLSMVDLTKGEH